MAAKTTEPKAPKPAAAKPPAPDATHRLVVVPPEITEELKALSEEINQLTARLNQLGAHQALLAERILRVAGETGPNAHALNFSADFTKLVVGEVTK